ncbi:hypothetical protein VNO77_36053 [Canavalia gladiata]|uniref:Arginine decarboxylase n=1 Tax=Canavalia gladiata TaxID=3824 RepID=A0AAN9PVG6_CANGL
MPAVACVDAAAALTPPDYHLAGDTSLPPPVTFSGVTTEDNSRWTPSMSCGLYRVDLWGPPYFSINSAGNVTVRPHGTATLPHQEIDLLKVVKKASDPKCCGGLGLQNPILVRFPDVLKNRLESLQHAFDSAIQLHGYESRYQGVYPVKSNQDRFIVEDIVEFGCPFRFGLEAGSKAELLLCMSCLCKGNRESLLVCNGYKDKEYISLALLARKLALNTVIVLEQEEELDWVIDISTKLCIRPVIGVRAKLKTMHSGHFGSTSGDKGKFGLTVCQILRVVNKLKQVGMLDCLQLLHFHIGSQIPSTAFLSGGVVEATQIYCELVRLGAQMSVFDVGGGLGIDYDGSKSSNSDTSVSYDLEEYAASVVHAVKYVCDRRNMKHPVICSESGRAIVSHHSVLVFQAISAETHEAAPALCSNPGLQLQCVGDELSEDARLDYQNISAATIRGEHETCLLYTDQFKQRCVEQFKQGTLGIEQLAAVDGMCDLIKNAIGANDQVHTYSVNLSVFSSMPDFWGIRHLYPILPIHRLDERPTVKGILSDLTCDSDGKIDKFIGGDCSLPLHEMEGHGYYLGMFLGGAYQEGLGGVHNLFGGSSVVRVLQSEGPHGFAVTHAVPGSSCADVLRLMQHEPELMFETLKHRAQEMLGEHQDDNDKNVLNSAALADSLARSFDKMPYLVTSSSSSCCFDAVNNNGFYYCSGDDIITDSAAASASATAGEDEQWSYSYA